MHKKKVALHHVIFGMYLSAIRYRVSVIEFQFGALLFCTSHVDSVVEAKMNKFVVPTFIDVFQQTRCTSILVNEVDPNVLSFLMGLSIRV